MGPVGFSVEQQDLIWAVWRRGDAIREMERTLGETLPRIRLYLREWGGIPLIPRQRRANQLSLAEREDTPAGSRPAVGTDDRPADRPAVVDGIAGDRPQWWARRLPGIGRRRGGVRAARRPKPSKLATHPELRGVVADKLDDDWSPQQIAQWLRREFGGDVAMQISHESIYRDLDMPSRKKHLMPACFNVCGASVRSDGRAERSVRTVAARSATWSPSVSDRPRPTPGRWPATGRAIWCSERAHGGGHPR